MEVKRCVLLSLLLCSCVLDVPTEQLSASLDTQEHEAGCFADTSLYTGRVRTTGWAEVQSYSARQCLPRAVELWCPSGIVDIEIWKTSYKHPVREMVLHWYGVLLYGTGHHRVDLGNNIVGGITITFYTRVRLMSGVLFYKPGTAPAGQTVNGRAFTKGTLGIWLDAPEVTMAEEKGNG